MALANPPIRLEASCLSPLLIGRLLRLGAPEFCQAQTVPPRSVLADVESSPFAGGPTRPRQGFHHWIVGRFGKPTSSQVLASASHLGIQRT